MVAFILFSSRWLARIPCGQFSVFIILLSLFPAPVAADDASRRSSDISAGFKAGKTETAVLELLVNMEKKGTHFLLLSGDDVLLSIETISEIGFKATLKTVAIEGKEYVSLLSLYPKIKFAIEEKESTLTIVASPELFGKNVISLVKERPSNVQIGGVNSAFLNYGVEYAYTDSRLDTKTFTAPFEAGVRLDDYFFFSSFNYTRADSLAGVQEKTIGLTSSVTKDDTELMRRYVFGDVTATAGNGGSTILLGGLSISKNFSLSPYFIKQPFQEVSGVLKTPSVVETYMNGSLITRETLPPGEFNIRNITPQIGHADARVVIRDAFGREETVASSFYVPAGLLQKGLHEYSYNFGKKRENYGTKSYRYGDSAFAGYHRLGITGIFTGEVRAEGDSEVTSFGGGGTLMLGSFGELQLSADRSRKYGKGGKRMSSILLLSNRNLLSLRLGLETFSRDYTNLTLAPSSNTSKNIKGAGLSGNMGRLGSLSFNYSKTTAHNLSDRELTSLSYSLRVMRKGNLSFYATRTIDTKTEDSLLVLFHYYFGAGKSASLSHEGKGGTRAVTAGYDKSLSSETGNLYNIKAKRIESDKTSYSQNARFEHRGDHGNYTLNYDNSDQSSSYRAGISGSIARIGGGTHFSRPLYDGFTLVRVKGVDGVKVRREGKEIGETDKKGELLVPGVISYLDRRISVDSRNLPWGQSFKGSHKKVVRVPYRTGSIVEFETAMLQAYEGRMLFVTTTGEKTPAKFAKLEIDVEGTVIETVTGVNGEFYFENILPGKYRVKILGRDGECDFDLVMPKSDKMIYNMGEEFCEIH